MSDHVEAEVTDGRRRKGLRRRWQLLEATVRVIGRDGLSAVSQRTVAREAGVPSSAVTYYFPTVDDLLNATLTASNDGYLRRLEECAEAPNALERLAALIIDGAAGNRADAAAEYELMLMAARRPELRTEVARWTAALETFLKPYVADPVHRTAVAAAVDGLMFRCCYAQEPPTKDAVLAMLESLLRDDRADGEKLGQVL